VSGSPYAITCALGSLTAGNYTFTFTPGELTVTKATLVVDANDKSRDYGDPNPAFDATITGFKNSETLATSGVAGSPLCNSAATATSPVSGSPYAITCALGSLTAGNYTFTFTPGELTVTVRDVTGSFTAADKVWDNSTAATVVTTTVVGAVMGDDVELTGGTATFANSMVGTWTVTLTGAGLTGSDAGNYNLTSVGTTTAKITTAFRIVGFDTPVDMTVTLTPRIYNSVKGGQTVPLKFRVFNLAGTEVTSTIGLSAWAKSVACVVGEVDPILLPTELASLAGLRRTGDRFHFNWAVPKAAGVCYRVFIQTVDGSTEMVGSLGSDIKLEAYFRSK
jgi:hypothetical protein